MAHPWRKSFRCTLRTPSGCYLRFVKPPHKRMSDDEYQRAWADRHDVGLCAPYAHPGVWPHHQHWQHIWTPHICRRYVILLATTTSHSHAHALARPNALTPTLVPRSLLFTPSPHRQHLHTHTHTHTHTLAHTHHFPYQSFHAYNHTSIVTRSLHRQHLLRH